MYYSFYIFITGSLSGWSHHLAFGLLRRSTNQNTRFMDFVADQLIGLFAVHFYLALTSPPTSWLDSSAYRFFTNQLVGLFVASSSATLGLVS